MQSDSLSHLRSPDRSAATEMRVSLKPNRLTKSIYSKSAICFNTMKQFNNLASYPRNHTKQNFKYLTFLLWTFFFLLIIEGPCEAKPKNSLIHRIMEYCKEVVTQHSRIDMFKFQKDACSFYLQI